MGFLSFKLVGRHPINRTGRSFVTARAWWIELHLLIQLSCSDILTAHDLDMLRRGKGYALSPTIAEGIAARLEEIAKDEGKWNEYEGELRAHFNHGCWTPESVLLFVDFLKASGGFLIK